MLFANIVTTTTDLIGRWLYYSYYDCSRSFIELFINMKRNYDYTQVIVKLHQIQQELLDAKNSIEHIHQMYRDRENSIIRHCDSRVATIEQRLIATESIMQQNMLQNEQIELEQHKQAQDIKELKVAKRDHEIEQQKQAKDIQKQSQRIQELEIEQQELKIQMNAILKLTKEERFDTFQRNLQQQYENTIQELYNEYKKHEEERFDTLQRNLQQQHEKDLQELYDEYKKHVNDRQRRQRKQQVFWWCFNLFIFFFVIIPLWSSLHTTS